MNATLTTRGKAVVLILSIFFLYGLSWSMQGCDEAVIAEPEPSYTEIEMNVSAYCPCEKCCENFADGITASGKPATGKLIAAPRNYSFGTKMDVPGYGTALVEDRGGAIKGNKIDLLFSTHHDALVWGRQYLTVRVYK